MPAPPSDPTIDLSEDIESQGIEGDTAMVTTRSAYGDAWAGWIIFAATLLLLIGGFNIIEGVVALINDERLVVVQDKLIAVDLTSWGWTLVIFGALMVATSIGLYASQTWARVTAIILVGLHALAQMGWLGAYPIWSLLMIALDVVVIYALTARWSAATGDLGPYGTEREGRMGQHASVDDRLTP
jgi:hypothetical protein